MDLWQCALGFMDSQVLLTAEEMRVFDVLEETPGTAAEVAEKVGLPEDSAERLLLALASLKIVRRDDHGRFHNGPEASEQLVRGKPGYIGSMFEHVREDLYPLWHHLKEALQEGTSQWKRAFPDRENRNADIFENPDELRAFMEGMHAITYKAAAEFASVAPELEEVGHVVDVGGASGAFLIALAERFEAMRGTVLDLPPVQPIAEDFFQQNGLDGRLDFHGADFWSDPLPEGADAYALGFILHDWNTEQGDFLLSKVAEAAPPGGMLILGEYLFKDDKSGPPNVARQNLNMLVAAKGRERSAREYGEWIGKHGFGVERVHWTSNGKAFLIARRAA